MLHFTVLMSRLVVHVEICMLVISSACLTKRLKETAVFFNSESSLVLLVQDLLEKRYHILNDTSYKISLNLDEFIWNRDMVLKYFTEISLSLYLLF